MKIIEPTKELKALNAALVSVMKKNIHNTSKKMVFSNKCVDEDRRLFIKNQKEYKRFLSMQ